MVSIFILLFLSGLTFAVGGINLAIGSVYSRDRSYLIFGFLSLFASLFLIIQVYSLSALEHFPLVDVISVVLAITFFTLFIWFIGEYTGYRKTKLQWFISFLAFSLLPLYFLVNYSSIPWKIWELIAHTTILLICIYGIVAGTIGMQEINKLWSGIFLFLMSILFITTILVGFNTLFETKLLFDQEGFVSPLDLFPVFFSIIIGSKMSHDILRSYQLDKELDNRERRWSAFIEKINLLVVELDVHGNIKYFNSFFGTFTGYTLDEVCGKDWFELMETDDAGGKTKTIFQDIMNGKDIPVYQNFIFTKNNDRKNVYWSTLQLTDREGNISGILSIGTDVTERESALAEIQQLKNQLEKENLLLREELNVKDLTSQIIGESDSIQYAIKRAIQVSGTDSTVLLEGETGVGKELFANLIHWKSKRSNKVFIKVNCSAIPKELIESEFFGHEKGSFTGALKTRQGRFELADNGTIFLDEVGEIPFELQAKLLRVLQSGEFERIGSENTKKVDVRIIAATNKDLDLEVQKGTFRQDLYYRLNVYPITIPPLRQREGDIPLLVRHFVDRIGKKMGKKIKEISKADLSKLSGYNWPGNVRELENIIERAIINSSGDILKIEDIQFASSLLQNHNIDPKTIDTNLSKTEKNHIISVLEGCNWKINGENGAAHKLGVPPSTLRSKMKKLNIVRPKD
jgi:chemotaxis protein methyltransferase CheR